MGIGDTVTESHIEAFVSLRDGPHAVKMVGVPKVDDKVLFKRKATIPPLSKPLPISIPGDGWDALENPEFGPGVKISAWAVFSPEMKEDRDLKVTLMAGGAKEDHVKFKITSGDS